MSPTLPPAPVRDFGSDNRAPISPDALSGLLLANESPRAASYGTDVWTGRAARALTALVRTDADPVWVPTGTAGNIAAIGALLDGPGTAVLAAMDAHLRVDEAGALERAWGVPVIGVPTAAGKLHPEMLSDTIEGLAGNAPFSPTPAVLSVSVLSETGRSYRLEELAALCDVAAAHGMRVHVDGARFANAHVVSPELAQLFTVGVDTMVLGCAKNGTGPVEAVLSARRETARRTARAAKQLGHTVSKMRYLTAGVAASLESGEFHRNAAQANDAARLLADRLADLNLQAAYEVDGNLVFLRLPPGVASALDAWCHVSAWDRDGLVRLACAWDHTPLDVERLCAGMAVLLA